MTSTKPLMSVERQLARRLKGLSLEDASNFDVYNKWDDELGIVTVAEAVSEAVVGEICQAGLQMANVTTKAAQPSNDPNSRKLQFLLDENQRIVDVRFAKNEDFDKMECNGDASTLFSSSTISEGQPGELLLADDETLTGSDITNRLIELERSDPNYFATNFKEADTSLVDSIEYFARNISALSYLSDIGFEDESYKTFTDIEKKVVQEYGLDYVKKYEKKMGEQEEEDSKLNTSTDDSTYRSDEETKITSFSELNTAEILDDILHTEFGGKEVTYDSSKETLEQQAKKVQEPEDALATRAAAAAIATSLILDDIRDWDNDTKSQKRDSIKLEGAGIDLENIGIGHHKTQSRYMYADTDGEDLGSRNQLEESTISPPGTHVDTDEVASTRKGLGYSFADTDLVQTPKRIHHQKENMKTLANSETLPYVESFAHYGGNQEVIVDGNSIAASSIDHVSSSSSGSSASGSNSCGSKDELGSESRQLRQQTLEVVHDPNGPYLYDPNGLLIPLPPYHRNPSFQSATTVASSAYYDNQEVMYDPNTFNESTHANNRSSHNEALVETIDYDFSSTMQDHTSSTSELSTYYDNKEMVYGTISFTESQDEKSRSNHSDIFVKTMDYASSAQMKNHTNCCDLRYIAPLPRTRSHKKRQQSKNQKLMSACLKHPLEIIDNAGHEHSDSSPYVEMQLNTDLAKSKGFPTRKILQSGKNLEKKTSLTSKAEKASNSTSKSSQKVRSHEKSSRLSSHSNKLRFLDPERLLCGCKNSHSRAKNENKVLSEKHASKFPTQSRLKGRKNNNNQDSKFKVDPSSAKTMQGFEGEYNSCENENVNNLSMETATTVATEDEDFLSQFRIDVRHISTMTSNDPSIPSVIEKTNESLKKDIDVSQNDNMQNSSSIQEDLSRKKYNNKNEDQPSTVVADAKASVTPKCNPAMQAVLEEKKQNHELADLLRKVSSYVDGIVENNTYSLSLPSIQLPFNSESNFDESKENNDEITIIMNATEDSKLDDTSMIDAIYVPTISTPENLQTFKIVSSYDSTDEEVMDNYSFSLFDNPLAFPESPEPKFVENSTPNLTNLVESSAPNLTKPQQALMDDFSEDSSLESSLDQLSTASTKSSEHQPDELQTPFEGDKPVVYHMSSSPLKSKRPQKGLKRPPKGIQKRLTSPPIKRHPGRTKAAAKAPMDQESNKKTMKDNNGLRSARTLSYRNIQSQKSRRRLVKKLTPVIEEDTCSTTLAKVNDETTTLQGIRPLQPPSPGPIERKNSNPCKEKVCPPTPPRTKVESDRIDLSPTTDGERIQAVELQQKERTSAHSRSKTELDGIDAKSPKSKAELDITSAITVGTAKSSCRGERKLDQKLDKNNKLVVDDHGFLLHRTTALLDDHKSANSSLNESETKSDAATFNPYNESSAKSVASSSLASFASSRSGSQYGDRTRPSSKSVTMTGSVSHLDRTSDVKKHSSMPEPHYWKSMGTTDRASLAHNRVVRSRLHRHDLQNLV